jgi:soluble lytic murein transglycosylase-like protein
LLKFCCDFAAISGIVATCIGTASIAIATENVSLPAPHSTLPASPQAQRLPLPGAVTRAEIRTIIDREALKAGLPADIAEAVVKVESSFDPTTIGSAGEIGLMQVRPGTAAMMGFRGSADELARPEVNIHYGVTYLAKAWRLASGDLCRALMKYRAGHGEEIMSALSVTYCSRARGHLAALGSPFATIGWAAAVRPFGADSTTPLASQHETTPNSVNANLKRGTPAASRAFWTAHEARVRAITAQLHARWGRVASR